SPPRVVTRGRRFPPETVLRDVRADRRSLARTFLLIEAEVDSAVDPGIVDVGGDLAEPRVLQHDVRQRGTRHGDAMPAAPEAALEHHAGRVAGGRVAGRVAREAGRGNERL